MSTRLPANDLLASIGDDHDRAAAAGLFLLGELANDVPVVMALHQAYGWLEQWDAEVQSSMRRHPAGRRLGGAG